MKQSILLVVVGQLLLGACGSDSSDTPDPGTGSDANADGSRQTTPDSGAPGQPAAGGDAGVGSADAGGPVAQGSLLPFKEGNTWTYRVTGDGETSDKVTTVGALEPVGGGSALAAEQAYKVVTKKGAEDQTVSWQKQVGDRVVRYREQSFHAGDGMLEAEDYWNPPKLHIDESAAHTIRGATWTEEYQETKVVAGKPDETHTARDKWSVDGVNQTVTVPAGTFTNAIVFVKAGGSSTKTYWYVPGVGKVKETGGQTEELLSFQVSP
jgi:hypothetical protein